MVERTEELVATIDARDANSEELEETLRLRTAERNYVNDVVNTYVEQVKELEAKLAKAVEHIEWFISEDETNRGDEPIDSLRGQTWNEVNAYWLENLDDAIAFVEELKKESQWH